MKNLTCLILNVLLLMSCNSKKQQGSIPAIDVTKSYPKKEIILQDIADVKYIPLETNDNGLIGRNYYVVPAGSDKVLVYDDGRSSGDILLFDTKGKFLRKFNHKGQSGQEYMLISDMFVDSKNKEIFIVSRTDTEVIQVYTMSGEYKRTLEYNNIDYFTDLIFDAEGQIICYRDLNIQHAWDKNRKQEETAVFALNKQKSKIDKKLKLRVRKGVDVICSTNLDGRRLIDFKRPKILVRSSEGVIVNEVAYDTIYALNNTMQLKPVLARIPQVSPSEDPLKMVGINAVTKENLYIEVMLKQCDFGNNHYNKKTYQLRRKDNSIFEYTLKNADVPSLNYFAKLDQYYLISADKLKELLETGKLKGKLKQIAERLNEDDNPVLVKITLKDS